MLTLLIVLLLAALALGAGEVVRSQCRRMLFAPVVQSRRVDRRR
jgi:hypothetical protein